MASFPNKCMKILIIKKLKNKLGQIELMMLAEFEVVED